MSYFRAKFEFHFGPYQAMVCPTFSASHSSNLVQILLITPANNNIIYHMPVSRAWVLPCTFVLVFLMKPNVSNDEIRLVAKLQKLKAIAVCLS